MAGSGAQLFALAQLTMIAGHHGISYYQFRGAGCQKILAARLGEDFLLTLPFIEHVNLPLVMFRCQRLSVSIKRRTEF
jgi:hypothetical protein